MQTEKSALIYIAIIFILMGLSISVSYYRYMVRQDFTYFQTEEQIQDRFDISSYYSL